MKFQPCCLVLSAALLSACGQAGPLVLPDKAAPAAPAPVLPALPGMGAPQTETPAATQHPKKEQP